METITSEGRTSLFAPLRKSLTSVWNSPSKAKEMRLGVTSLSSIRSLTAKLSVSFEFMAVSSGF
jgi:hypothetical protein